ncbi:uncharacterized protein MYCGRDRAFT_97732 [Zymoseptoria tritici IPO323]|uniref:Uncharacterized protein n=1 Tax=Zymoseptoria tritici (strain CBS 115943 / IPO323) TaxID=336722 RepID=F9XR72_ZYMTI|nr:uncharacterized protein MYCGRDRAFT_97732 [Zymoseptoria tritici IPO323]EGP82261.1 hypothetical protein MYCGRDRAFT_97732 [Zymoseptoria tritici IPO323]
MWKQACFGLLCFLEVVFDLVLGLVVVELLQFAEVAVLRARDRVSIMFFSGNDLLYLLEMMPSLQDDARYNGSARCGTSSLATVVAGRHDLTWGGWLCGRRGHSRGQLGIIDAISPCPKFLVDRGIGVVIFAGTGHASLIERKTLILNSCRSLSLDDFQHGPNSFLVSTAGC